MPKKIYLLETYSDDCYYIKEVVDGNPQNMRPDTSEYDRKVLKIRLPSGEEIEVYQDIDSVAVRVPEGSGIQVTAGIVPPRSNMFQED